MSQTNHTVNGVIKKEQNRLLNFIRKKVPDAVEAEDILQGVFIDFVNAYRLPDSIEQPTAWLYHVARNRIVDFFRKKKEAPISSLSTETDETTWLDQVLPASENGPEAIYWREVLLDAISDALATLPETQRSVFVAHEVEGKSFKDLSLETGIPQNTLLARKRYAILNLRQQLQPLYNQMLEDI